MPNLKTCLIAILTFFTVNLGFGQNVDSTNPAKVLDAAVGKLNSAQSVNCKFRIESGSGNINGVFKSSGASFVLDTPEGKTWFNGKEMWTSNPRTKEITLVNPSKSEVGEVNPFAYINGYKSNYVVGFSKRKDNSRYLVVLNPRKPIEEVKAVEIAINKKTLLPERFIIRDKNDKITTVYIDALSIGSGNPKSLYECPVSSMTDYELIDLR